MSTRPPIDPAPYIVAACGILLLGALIFGIRCDIENRQQQRADDAACLTWQDEYRQCEPGNSDTAKSCRSELRTFRPIECPPPRPDKDEE